MNYYFFVFWPNGRSAHHAWPVTAKTVFHSVQKYRQFRSERSGDVGHRLRDCRTVRKCCDTTDRCPCRFHATSTSSNCNRRHTRRDTPRRSPPKFYGTNLPRRAVPRAVDSCRSRLQFYRKILLMMANRTAPWGHLLVAIDVPCNGCVMSLAINWFYLVSASDWSEYVGKNSLQKTIQAIIRVR